MEQPEWESRYHDTLLLYPNQVLSQRRELIKPKEEDQSKSRHVQAQPAHVPATDPLALLRAHYGVAKVHSVETRVSKS